MELVIRVALLSRDEKAGRTLHRERATGLYRTHHCTTFRSRLLSSALTAR
ncbi:hypothetical protein [Streptomyces sp. TR06-5]